MKNIYAIFLFLVLSGSMNSYSQTDINSFNSVGNGYSTTRLSDYQCLGINPANLGWTWDNHSISVGLGETGFNIYTNALTKHQVTHDLFNDNIELSFSERIDAAADFTDTKVWGQGGITWLGISYNNEKIGGFAISIRDRVLWNTVLNEQAAEFTFLGYHAPYFDSLAVTLGDTTGYSTNPLLASAVYGNTRLHFLWYREYSLGYGRKIIGSKNFTLYGGFTVKYIRGYGTVQYIQDASGIQAYSSLGPEFQIDYGVPTPSEVSGSGVKKVGDGYAFDIGFTLEILKKIKVGIAVTDIGQIKWNGNVYEGKNVSVYSIATPGITNYNIFSQGQLVNAQGLPSEGELYSGINSKTVRMPTQIRIGGEYQIIPLVQVGLDVVAPFNETLPGSYDKAVLGFGGIISPAKWIDISAGFVTGADVGSNYPLGLTFYPIRKKSAAWAVGLATRDISTIWRQEDIMASVVFGFFRISVGSLGSE
jgi:hypothetical protein